MSVHAAEVELQAADALFADAARRRGGLDHTRTADGSPNEGSVVRGVFFAIQADELQLPVVAERAFPVESDLVSREVLDRALEQREWRLAESARNAAREFAAVALEPAHADVRVQEPVAEARAGVQRAAEVFVLTVEALLTILGEGASAVEDEFPATLAETALRAEDPEGDLAAVRRQRIAEIRSGVETAAGFKGRGVHAPCARARIARPDHVRDDVLAAQVEAADLAPDDLDARNVGGGDAAQDV